ncbi:ras-specific guanine nucleotide-releasing factor RalGPS1 isoform X2 [Daktulosphaira vitifoliae]|uniref:ras-specific guanine nucleotide-releasing factor RalGPS1 isoform X2 n=1 Tax=Daktulosphaira vitifoliae TaxID=58002 RepID=UPI0021AA1214|nr:ras-specific guanine nucleotide-releasing factor RalGPS1 isoform X2 [Daktulosphaira vitifoliae]XP_050538376.1 ras-specific guanine nucleotide-releasing factor RalGPS1 isoform X2 [Daktulosphaira vitifoliae]XP_050538377.1 ras-specific guanine nucleotide-releasing factor RalGPS1 isoform X2 [Daktulosphaira vitifoliae]XP_050538378.1 ras-specific guanine nucleotide-releasing factor RalGPS1 isoform X2 [Daktulosphaira vitifoliae]XP_050538379.1 ras-specific guanine nucleotide-releasing factor RalGPS1
MAKMRYAEMPRDVSIDDFPSLNVSEKVKSKVLDNEDSYEYMVSNTEYRKLTTYNSLKKYPSNLSTPSNEQKHKRRLSETLTCGLTRQCKSHSLPCNMTLKQPCSATIIDEQSVDPTKGVLTTGILPEDWASQLTHLDLEIFHQISPEELSSCAWNKKQKLEVSPNVVAFSRQFNHVSFWVVQEILKGVTPKLRADLITQFIKISKKLYELNNFHSLFAVISSLQSASVYRLSKSWNNVSKKDRQSFDKLANVFSESNNWRNLRDHLETLRLPCIPYLGVFLTDLVYVDMAHPHKNSGLMESEARRLKMNNILRVISHMQSSRYDHLTHFPKIHDYLNSIRYIEELHKFVQDDQYKLSLKLEPLSCQNDNSKDSKDSVNQVLLESLSLSPAKSSDLLRIRKISFTKNHPKTSSCSKYRSASLPRSFLKKNVTQSTVYNNNSLIHKSDEGILSTVNSRNLLDDSLIEENVLDLSNLMISPLQTLKGTHKISLESCLRRKVVLKNGRKPAVTTWQRYWIQLWASVLIYYAPKSFKGCSRNDFKREPCKLCPLKGCTVSLGDNPDTFFIKHSDQRNSYKFRAESDNTALQWYRRLYHAAQTKHQTETKLPDNLISFD